MRLLVVSYVKLDRIPAPVQHHRASIPIYIPFPFSLITIKRSSAAAMGYYYTGTLVGSTSLAILVGLYLLFTGKSRRPASNRLGESGDPGIIDVSRCPPARALSDQLHSLHSALMGDILLPLGVRENRRDPDNGKS